jgi:predicted nucleotidyltransferase
MDKEQLLQKVKQTIQRIDPQAEVILFGSRARGDARPDSDWDFLILVSKEDTAAFREQIWDALYEEVELPFMQIISALIHEKEDWQEVHRVTPLYHNISKEGSLI